MRIMLRDNKGIKVLYAIDSCSIDPNTKSFYFMIGDTLRKITFDEDYMVNLELIMDSLFHDGRYSFYGMSNYKIYEYDKMFKKWQEII